MKIIKLVMFFILIATTGYIGYADDKDYAAALKHYVNDSSFKFGNDYWLVSDERGLTIGWNIPNKQKPTIADLDAIMDEVMEPIKKQKEKDTTEKLDMEAKLKAATSNILATAQSLGITNVPINWQDIDTKVQQIAATNQAQGMYIGILLQKDLLFYVLNGGNPRKIGE